MVSSLNSQGLKQNNSALLIIALSFELISLHFDVTEIHSS